MAVEKDKKNKHSTFIVFLKFQTYFLILLAIGFAIYLSGIPEDDPILVDESIESVYAKFPVETLPPDWVYLTWLVVAVYLLIWIIYDMSLLCRKPKEGKGYLYNRPPFIPRTVYIGFSVSVLAFIGWMGLWLVELLKWAALAMSISALLGIYATVMAAMGLRDHGDKLKKLGNLCDVKMDRILVQNPLALYSAWLLIVALLNLAIALVHEWDQTNLMTTTIVLASVGGVILVYFILDILVFSKSLRYILTPYIVFTVFLASVLSKDFEGGDRNFLLSLFMLGLAGFTTLFKFGSMLSHACKKEPTPSSPKHHHHHHHHHHDKKKLLEKDSDSEDEFSTTADEDEDEEVDESDEEAAKYIKQAQYLLVKKK